MNQVIVTLTTIPSRLTPENFEYGIKSNLNSLLNQDYEGEYEIHFNVPSKLLIFFCSLSLKSNKEEIPKSIIEIESFS